MLTDKRKVNKLITLFTLTYMVSYITRINFGAIISEMESSTGMSKSLLSMSLTGSFITYGIGQVISGFLGDRISPKRLVSIGFIITVLMNFLIPLAPSPSVMLAVWCVNGFAQSLMWPPMVKLMTSLLSDADYKEAGMKVMWGSSFGTIFVYMAAPVLIFLFKSWKSVFFFSALSGILMLAVWNRLSPDVDVKKEKTESKKSGGSLASLFSPVMICIMFAVVLMGALRDGATTWMPSYISETYSMSNLVSILSGVILPLFGVLCFKLSSVIYTKKLNNPVSCSVAFYIVAVMSGAGLLLFTGNNAFLSILMFSVLTGCMHGVNYVLISIVPSFFKKTGNVSLASGVINACTYIGSAISTYGVALVRENSTGWTSTLAIWLCFAVLGSILCLVSVKPWYNKYQK